MARKVFFSFITPVMDGAHRRCEIWGPLKEMRPALTMTGKR